MVRGIGAAEILAGFTPFQDVASLWYHFSEDHGGVWGENVIFWRVEEILGDFGYW